MTAPAQLALFGRTKPAPPVVPAPPPPPKPRPPAEAPSVANACDCAWSRGLACEALLSAPGDIPQQVAYHIARGGADTGCPGRKNRR